MRLVINEPGSFLGVKQGMITVKKGGKKVAEVAPPKIKLVAILTRGASFSSAFLRLLAKHRIPLIVYNSFGLPVSITIYPRRGGLKLRREQRGAQGDGRGAALAKAFVHGKIRNQRALIYSMAKNRRRSNPSQAKSLREASWELKEYAKRALSVEGGLGEARGALVEVEASAAKVYWDAVKEALPEELGFPGRRKRFEDPRDPVNVSLNYLYTVLAGEVWLNLECSGFDPYVGFLHADSPRRPALAMDLMEEFRQPVVDRAVFKLVYERKLRGALEGGKLRREARFALYKSFSERLRAKVTFRNRALPLESHVLLQARRLGAFLLGHSPSYEPYVEW